MWPLVLALSLAAPDAEARLEERDPTDCAGCHAALDASASIDFVEGGERPARVPQDALHGSVHAELGCVDCHPGVGPYPHPGRAFVVERDFERELARGCGRCHQEISGAMRDGIHGARGAAGQAEAATCVDCHGGHGVKTPGEPRGAISERCGECHEGVLETYRGSVHGSAVEEGDPDTPTCTSCHGAHAIADPESRAWKASHQICADCHRDAKLMAEHDLSPDVVRTYLDDFHGMSNTLFLESGEGARAVFATCSGCHGSHDVRSLTELEGTPEHRERVSAMCERCHEGAPESFSDAWMGHRDISAATAPIAWLIKLVYYVMIPFILVALFVHILLDLSQARAREMLRRKRNG